MDRVRRWYSVDVVEEAPGPGVHHPACPCCLFRADVEHACRSAYGMRGAGFGDDTIDVELRREGWNEHVRAAALEFARTLPPPSNTHQWCGQTAGFGSRNAIARVTQPHASPCC